MINLVDPCHCDWNSIMSNRCSTSKVDILVSKIQIEEIEQLPELKFPNVTV